MAAVQIGQVLAPSDDIRRLIAALDRELSGEYPPEQRHGLSLDAIFQPHIRFFLARLDGVAVGCGGVALFPDYAEVKRMYVADAARGQRVAQAILAQIETIVRQAGLTLLQLETGDRQTAAMLLYERVGFQRCAAFGAYAAMPEAAIVTSVFFKKNLP